jgi:dihydrolipoamide dehydrogenase
MPTKSYDAVVIGAGPGGYVCAIRLGQLGKKTAVIDAGELGGVCLNVGCIPSKAIITASKRYAELDRLATMGVSVKGADVDMGAMQRWKAGVVKKLTGGVAMLLKGNGVDVIKGRARLTGPKTLVVDGPEPMTIEASAIVIATGSTPIAIPGFAFDGQTVLDSTGALALETLPKHLVVIGGGYIGLELGGAFGRLGSRVTVVEAMTQLLPGFEADIVRLVERKLKAHGAKILLEHKAKSWKKTDTGAVCTVLDKAGAPVEIECDAILVTVGRRPTSSGLGLDAAGVAVDARGFITVDEKRRTNVPGIYAIGDVVGNPMLAHKASAEGEVVAEVIAGHDVVFDPRAIPAIVFTDPEIGAVGLSESEAIAKGHAVKTGKYPFAGLGRAMTTGETDGFVRVIIDEKTTEILGVQIVGPEASDLIAEAGLAIEMGAVALDVGLTIHGHPTLAEAFMEAAKAAIGQSVHQLNR